MVWKSNEFDLVAGIAPKKKLTVCYGLRLPKQIGEIFSCNFKSEHTVTIFELSQNANTFGVSIMLSTTPKRAKITQK